MSLRIFCFVCIGCILTFAGGELHGQATPRNKAKPASAALTDNQVKLLVKQMGGAKEADQKIATQKLRAAGIDVIPALGKAASEGNRQATNNAIEILKSHVEGDDLETRLAAFEVLRRLSTGSRPAVAAATKKIIEDHKDLRVESDAARASRAERATKKSSSPKANPKPTPPTASDPATNLRRQALEQSLKDAEKSIQEIKKLKLPKELEAQQISAITQSMQNLREQLKRLDNPRRKK